MSDLFFIVDKSGLSALHWMGLATILAKISIRFEAVAGNGREVKEDDKPDVEAESPGGEGAEHILQEVQGKE